MKYFIDNKKKNVNTELSAIINSNFDNLERVKDIEESGLCIISNKEYEKDVFILLLLLIPNSLPIQAFAYIAWQKKINENIYETCIEFCYMAEEGKKILRNYIQI